MTDILDYNKYITLQEVCQLLQISVATGRNWIKQGKIEPQYIEGKKSYFTKEYVDSYKKDIEEGVNTSLKSRRNKKYVSGNSLYKSYVSKQCENVTNVNTLLQILEEENIQVDNQVLGIIVADCAVKLMKQRHTPHNEIIKNGLRAFFAGDISFGGFDKLIYDLIEDVGMAIKWIENYNRCLSIQYKYEEKEDILGLLYISCKNIGNRKATGSYYTPTNIVRKLVSKVFESTEKYGNVLDPCCGTGNFLLQLPDYISIENIYGYDIDDISVKLTRINMALKFENVDVDTIYTHIKLSDYLKDQEKKKFDIILGNPPWGYCFDEEDSDYLRKNYLSATGKTIESYDVFIEKSIKKLEKDGLLSFVIPEAILNVKAHMQIRQLILDNTSIPYVDFLGDTFDKVQCPCVILQLKNTRSSFSCIGMEVNNGKRVFKIERDRSITPECFSFNMTDDEYMVLSKLTSFEPVEYLKGKAIFALGLVTGNNKEYISNVKTENNEIILKGADICKYKINPMDNYILFKPEKFQQVAPTDYYRAPEKLIYRFISNQLVFAYDDNQTLSLNSANILIPQIEGMKIKYILAVLNSRVAQYIFKMKFNSIKVLRSHIESIPIPIITLEQQEYIIEIVDCLMNEKSEKTIMYVYEKLDDEIRKIYGLSESEYELIKMYK